MSQSPELRPTVHGPEPTEDDPPASPFVSRTVRGGRIEVPEFTRRQLGYLLLFTLAACALRFWNLGEWSFWVDEAHTYRDVLASDELFWSSGTSRYPLSFLLLRGLTGMFGLTSVDLTEEVMRLPFAFFGIASVPALAIVARGMIGRRAALLAALFLALSPWHIYWSQNARSYSMVLFVSVITMGAVYYGYHRRSKVLLGIAILLCLVAGLCHPSAYAVSAAALLYLAVGVYARRDTRSWIGGKWAPLVLLGALALLVVLSLPVLEHARQVKRAEISVFHLIQTLVFYVGTPVLVAASGGMLVLFDRGEKSAPFLTGMAVVSLVSLLVLSSGGFFQKMSAQYAIAALPAIHMLAAVLVIALSSVFRGKGLRPLVLRLVPLGIVIVHMLGQDYLYFQKENGWRPRWAEAAQYVRLHARASGNREVLVLTTNEPSLKYYFDADRHAAGADHEVGVSSIDRWTFIDPKTGRKDPEAYFADVILRARKAYQDLWVVVTAPDLDDKDIEGRADGYLRKHFRQIRRLPNWTGPKDMCILIYRLE